MRRPVSRRWRARSITARTSARPALTAESSSKAASACSAASRASVVLPVPGGPNRTIECGSPDSSDVAQRRALAEQVLLADVARRACAGACGRPAGPLAGGSATRASSGGSSGASNRRSIALPGMVARRAGGLAHDGAARMGPDRRDRLRRPARARRAAARARAWSGAAGSTAREFEDANAACQLLPGPASTQLSIYCARRVAGTGGRAGRRPRVHPARAGRDLAIAAVALQDDPPALGRAARGGRGGRGRRRRRRRPGSGWREPSLGGRAATAAARGRLPRGIGAVAAVAVGPCVVLVLLAAGRLELALRRRRPRRAARVAVALAARRTGAAALPALAWTALKVGALSYGGGFVIVPLMQGDALDPRLADPRRVRQRRRLRADHARPGRRTRSRWSAGRAGGPGRRAAAPRRSRSRRRSSFVLLGGGALRAPARPPGPARVPRRRRPGRGRRDPRRGGAARRRAGGRLAVGRARRAPRSPLALGRSPLLVLLAGARRRAAARPLSAQLYDHSPWPTRCRRRPPTSSPS